MCTLPDVDNIGIEIQIRGVVINLSRSAGGGSDPRGPPRIASFFFLPALLITIFRRNDVHTGEQRRIDDRAHACVRMRTPCPLSQGYHLFFLSSFIINFSLQRNPYEVLPSATFWTRSCRGHSCLSSRFFPRYVPFVLSRKEFIIRTFRPFIFVDFWSCSLLTLLFGIILLFSTILSKQNYVAIPKDTGIIIEPLIQMSGAP